MSKFYKYTETASTVPDSFQKAINVGGKNLTIEFIWPSYIEEEVYNINLAAYARMAGQGLDDGRQLYDYFDYWEDTVTYLTTHTAEQWINDTTKAHPVVALSKTGDDLTDWLNEQMSFYFGCLEMLDFYNELLVWEVRISYGGETLSSAVNLGGWTDFPDGSFSFRFSSASKEHIGRSDLPLLNIYFEVFDE